MIIIRRPNPAFFGNLPSHGTDADVDSQTLSHNPGEDGQYCRRFVLVPSDAPEVTKKQEPAEKVDPDVILEKNPLHCRETSEMTTLLLDVASFKPDQLKIEIENHVLIVAGKRTNKLGDTFATNRRFALQTNTYDEDSIRANLDDGILEITIQKKIPPKCRRIAITVGGHAPSSSNDANPNGTKDEQVNHSKEAGAATGINVGQTEEVSVETVNEGDDDEDTTRRTTGSGLKTAEAHEESSASSTRSQEDHWEKVAQA